MHSGRLLQNPKMVGGVVVAKSLNLLNNMNWKFVDTHSLAIYTGLQLDSCKIAFPVLWITSWKKASIP